MNTRFIIQDYSNSQFFKLIYFFLISLLIAYRALVTLTATAIVLEHCRPQQEEQVRQGDLVKALVRMNNSQRTQGKIKDKMFFLPFSARRKELIHENGKFKTQILMGKKYYVNVLYV